MIRIEPRVRPGGERFIGWALAEIGENDELGDSPGSFLCDHEHADADEAKECGEAILRVGRMVLESAGVTVTACFACGSTIDLGGLHVCMGGAHRLGSDALKRCELYEVRAASDEPIDLRLRIRLIV